MITFAKGNTCYNSKKEKRKIGLKYFLIIIKILWFFLFKIIDNVVKLEKRFFFGIV